MYRTEIVGRSRGFFAISKDEKKVQGRLAAEPGMAAFPDEWRTAAVPLSPKELGL